MELSHAQWSEHFRSSYYFLCVGVRSKVHFETRNLNTDKLTTQQRRMSEHPPTSKQSHHPQTGQEVVSAVKGASKS